MPCPKILTGRAWRSSSWWEVPGRCWFCRRVRRSCRRGVPRRTPTGQSKLATLAQELGMNLLPEAFMPEDFKTARVKNISEALVRGELAADAASISLNLTTPDGKQGVARLIWPLAKPSQVADPVQPRNPSRNQPPPRRQLLSPNRLPRQNPVPIQAAREAGSTASQCRRASELHEKPAEDQGSGRRDAGRKEAAVRADRRDGAGHDHPVREIVRRDARIGSRRAARSPPAKRSKSAINSASASPRSSCPRNASTRSSRRSS